MKSHIDKKTRYGSFAILASVAAAVLLSACGGGDGALGTDTSAAEISAGRGSQFSSTQSMRTTTHLLSSMSWSSSTPTQLAPELILTNADCSIKVQQDAAYLPKKADRSGSSDWSCTVYGTVPSDAPVNSVYTLLLKGTDDVGNVQTTQVPLRIK